MFQSFPIYIKLILFPRRKYFSIKLKVSGGIMNGTTSGGILFRVYLIERVSRLPFRFYCKPNI